MQTEGGYDPVTINGQSYSGGQGVGTTVKASGDITFSSDSSVTRPGFEICVNPIVEQSEEEGKQYYPIMYFVDKEYINVAQTCTGDIIGSPIYFRTTMGVQGLVTHHTVRNASGLLISLLERASPTCVSCFPKSILSNTTLTALRMLSSLPAYLSCRRRNITAHSRSRRNQSGQSVLRSFPNLLEQILNQTKLAKMTSS